MDAEVYNAGGAVSVRLVCDIQYILLGTASCACDRKSVAGASEHGLGGLD